MADTAALDRLVVRLSEWAGKMECLVAAAGIENGTRVCLPLPDADELATLLDDVVFAINSR